MIKKMPLIEGVGTKVKTTSFSLQESCMYAKRFFTEIIFESFMIYSIELPRKLFFILILLVKKNSCLDHTFPVHLSYLLYMQLLV